MTKIERSKFGEDATLTLYIATESHAAFIDNPQEKISEYVEKTVKEFNQTLKKLGIGKIIAYHYNFTNLPPQSGASEISVFKDLRRHSL